MLRGMRLEQPKRRVETRIWTLPRCPKAPKKMLSAFLAGTRKPEPD